MTVYLSVVVVVIIASIIILWKAEKSVNLKLEKNGTSSVIFLSRQCSVKK
jgi:hypothetical protein